MTLYEKYFPSSTVLTCSSPLSEHAPRSHRTSFHLEVAETMSPLILIPKQITGVAIPLLHGVVVITSETTTTLHMQDRVATICASNIVIFPTLISVYSRPTGQFPFFRFRPLFISRVLLPFSCVCVAEGRGNRETERQSDTVT